MLKKLCTPALFPLVALSGPEIRANELNPDISVTLDGYYKQEDTALSHREEGFGLGHTEVTLSAPIDDLFFRATHRCAGGT